MIILKARFLSKKAIKINYLVKFSGRAVIQATSYLILIFLIIYLILDLFSFIEFE